MSRSIEVERERSLQSPELKDCCLCRAWARNARSAPLDSSQAPLARLDKALSVSVGQKQAIKNDHSLVFLRTLCIIVCNLLLDLLFQLLPAFSLHQ